MPGTRRDSLKLVVLGGLSATHAARAQSSHLPDSHASDQPGYEHSPYKAPTTPAYSPKTFTAAEGAILSAIVDLLIPATDTPGALAAGAPQYIDNVAAANPARRKLLGEGFGLIDARSRSHFGRAFIELSAEQQVELITAIASRDAAAKDPQGAAFFQAIKDLTVDGYYGSYAGLVLELGYRGNQMLSSFPGCTHDHEL